jgi:hypothetical protein
MKHQICRTVLAAAAVTADVFLSACGLFRDTTDSMFDDAEDAIATDWTASNLKTASVYVSILGAKNEEEEARIVRRLIERKSEIQSLMSKEVILKYTPVLHFVLDHSVADGDRVLDLLRHMEDENAGD